MPEDELRRYINLGCGQRYHPGWTNFDIVPSGPGVIVADLSRGIPMPGASCDVVYHSHVLEHVRRDEVLPFMRECWRVLRPGGTLRVATPDLEQICRLYLAKLSAADAGEARADYDWMMLELYDQTVREQTGGNMLEYLAQEPFPNEDFVFGRIGEEGRRLVGALKARRAGKRSRPSLRRLWQRLPVWYGRAVTTILLGRWGRRAFKIGAFRLEGEVHQWMYDHFSLARLMLAAGFVAPVVQPATASRIPDWSSFNLDTLPDGSTVKPDSLFMEASKSDPH